MYLLDEWSFGTICASMTQTGLRSELHIYCLIYAWKDGETEASAQHNWTNDYIWIHGVKQKPSWVIQEGAGLGEIHFRSETNEATTFWAESRQWINMPLFLKCILSGWDRLRSRSRAGTNGELSWINSCLNKHKAPLSVTEVNVNTSATLEKINSFQCFFPTSVSMAGWAHVFWDCCQRGLGVESL